MNRPEVSPAAELHPARPEQARGLQTIRRPAKQSGLECAHARTFRRTAPHTWFAPGGQEQDLRSLLGWRSRATVSRYHAGAADESHWDAFHHDGLGDRL